MAKASAKNLDELWARYVEWCIDRLMEDRLDCCQVPPEFHVLCEQKGVRWTAPC